MVDSGRYLVAVGMAVAALGSGVLVGGCGGGGDASTSTTSADTSRTTTTAPAESTGQKQKAGGGGQAKPVNASADQFDPGKFGDPTASTNQWLPLRPGTQWVREGFVNVGSRRLPHRVVTTVTDVSKEVDGVRTVVVVDQDFNGGQLAEESLDYVSEDKQGNVWYLGSYTEAYEGGQFLNASDAWLAGINGAKPGILMLADPQEGTPPYTEDTVPGIEAPAAHVAKTNQSQCVPFKCYKDALVIQEGEEYKYFAPGVGQIKTEPLSSGGKQEVENLINLTRLSPSGLAQISAETVKLDKHAATTAPDVFGNAKPAKRTL